MSEFDDFIRGIGSDIKNAAEKVGKKQYGFKMYLPSRTAVCLAKKK